MCSFLFSPYVRTCMYPFFQCHDLSVHVYNLNYLGRVIDLDNKFNKKASKTICCYISLHMHAPIVSKAFPDFIRLHKRTVFHLIYFSTWSSVQAILVNCVRVKLVFILYLLYGSITSVKMADCDWLRSTFFH